MTDEEDEDDEETAVEDLISCVLIGAATGAGAGFVADMSVATFGVGAMAFALSVFGGGVAGAVNSATTQYVLDEDIDIWKVAYDAGWGGLMGGTCTAMGTNPTTPPRAWREARIFVDAMISTEIFMITTEGFIGSGLSFDIAATAVTSFGAWVAGCAYGYFKGIYERID